MGKKNRHFQLPQVGVKVKMRFFQKLRQVLSDHNEKKNSSGFQQNDNFKQNQTLTYQN